MFLVFFPLTSMSSAWHIWLSVPSFSTRGISVCFSRHLSMMSRSIRYANAPGVPSGARKSTRHRITSFPPASTSRMTSSFASLPWLCSMCIGYLRNNVSTRTKFTGTTSPAVCSCAFFSFFIRRLSRMKDTHTPPCLCVSIKSIKVYKVYM